MKKLILTTGFILVWSFCLLAQKAPSASPKTSIARGKKVYETYCLACHQANGSGVPMMNPPLVKTSFVKGNKSKMIGIVLNGLKETEIDGEDYSNPMPPFGTTLKDQEIADVISYVRNSFGNKYGSVTVAQVKTTRSTIINTK